MLHLAAALVCEVTSPSSLDTGMQGKALHRLFTQICYVTFGELINNGGTWWMLKSNGLMYTYHYYSHAVEASFMAKQVEWMAPSRS